MFWIFLLLILSLMALSGTIYVVIRCHKFNFIQQISKKHKFLSWLISLLPVAVTLCFSIINIYTSIILLLHLIIIWMICDLIGFIIKKLSKKSFKRYISGFIAIIVTIVYMSGGWYLAHNVRETHYSFTTSKTLGTDNLRIVEIADSHIGITLDGEKFSKEMEKIQKTNPDILFILGDFVDDDTLKKDMIEACKALGRFKTTYGIYYVFGNHDKGYSNYRDFDTSDLRKTLNDNNIVILEDESVLINNSFYIIGRQDRSTHARAGMRLLTKDLDKSKYMIVLDHQPNDYQNQENAEVDLVLSGHTHGGHIFPTGIISLWIKANDKVYGSETRKKSTFVVTSGISGWAIPFKTGTQSEFVIIDLKSTNK